MVCVLGMHFPPHTSGRGCELCGMRVMTDAKLAGAPQTLTEAETRAKVEGEPQ